MTSTSILGPFSFEDTVTGESYIDMLKRFYFPHDKRQGNLDQVVFQQDDASVHVAGQVKEFLDDTFGTRIISRGFDYEWPPYCLDLSPLVYFLWGFLKSKVYMPGSHPKNQRPAQE